MERRNKERGLFYFTAAALPYLFSKKTRFLDKLLNFLSPWIKTEANREEHNINLG